MFSATRTLLRPYTSTILGDALRTTLAQRQIDIRTSRPLRKIAERRCLLSALQRFGEVNTFLPVKDDPDHKILAIYDTSEAARKAINASPLTIRLPAHAHVTNDETHSVHCDIAQPPETTTTTADYEEPILEGNPQKPTKNLADSTWDKIIRDPRIADVAAAGLPRREFAYCLVANTRGTVDWGTDQESQQEESHAKREKGESRDRDNGDTRTTKKKENKIELIAKGSLMAFMEK